MEHPRLKDKLINFSKASFDHVVNGMPKTSKPEQEARLEVCKSNTCGIFDSAERVCTHDSCGCFVDIKSSWADQDCPLGLWPKTEGLL